MKREGWARLYSIPGAVIVPGYAEAVEETGRVMAEEDQRMARDRREAKRELAAAVREEYGKP